MPFDSAEKRRTWMANRHGTRVAAAESYLGGCCVVCGTEDDLEFDHIDPTTKVSNVTMMTRHSAEVFWAEVAKCQLLCVLHHHEKTGVDRPRWRHGTIHGYINRDCRCTECHEAMQAYNHGKVVERSDIRLQNGSREFNSPLCLEEGETT